MTSQASEQVCAPRGPRLLTDEQLRFECKALMGKTKGTRKELMEELLSEMATRQIGLSNFTVDNEIVTNMMVKLSLTASIVTGGKENWHYTISPTNGSVVVPIQVKGVSILASLSTNSFVTVVPRSIVDTFWLKTKPITSSQFITLCGEGHVSVAAVINEFKFLVGNIEICLNNAVVLVNECVHKTV